MLALPLIDDLVIIVQLNFNLDPFSAALFVFCNKNVISSTCSTWNEFSLYYRRLEKATLNDRTILVKKLYMLQSESFVV